MSSIFYPERKRSALEQILIDQFVARGVTQCRPAADDTCRARRGGALPADLDPVRLGERNDQTVAEILAEVRAEERGKRERFHAAMRTPRGMVHR